jgi:hypothetical protein
LGIRAPGQTTTFGIFAGVQPDTLKPMRAMVLTQQKSVEELPLTQQEMDAPRGGPREVQVKISVCAVCRTDLHIVEGISGLTGCRSSPAIRLLGEWTKPPRRDARLRVGRRIGIATACGRDLPILPARTREPVSRAPVDRRARSRGPNPDSTSSDSLLPTPYSER